MDSFRMSRLQINTAEDSSTRRRDSRLGTSSMRLVSPPRLDPRDTSVPHRWSASYVTISLSTHRLTRVLSQEGQNPNNGQMSFDNVPAALLQVVIVASANTWTTIMFNMQDSEYFLSALYFIACLVTLNFWLINLFVAVITNTFASIREQTSRSAFGSDRSVPVASSPRVPTDRSSQYHAHDRLHNRSCTLSTPSEPINDAGTQSVRPHTTSLGRPRPRLPRRPSFPSFRHDALSTLTPRIPGTTLYDRVRRRDPHSHLRFSSQLEDSRIEETRRGRYHVGGGDDHHPDPCHPGVRGLSLVDGFPDREVL